MITQKNLEAFAAQLAAQAGVAPPAGIAPAPNASQLHAQAVAQAQAQAQSQAQLQAQLQEQARAQVQAQLQAQLQAQAQAVGPIFQVSDPQTAKAAVSQKVSAAEQTPAQDSDSKGRQFYHLDSNDDEIVY
ncbi:hypothetical protein GGF37_005291 [Kickxella alabastrina]|nr:hypothetical protein GGF37_005291 [Kickxella alabastrina]